MHRLVWQSLVGFRRSILPTTRVSTKLSNRYRPIVLSIIGGVLNRLARPLPNTPGEQPSCQFPNEPITRLEDLYFR